MSEAATTFSDGRAIDVARLIDDRRMSSFNYKLIALSWLITLFDGLDQMMISFTAPYMRDEFGLSTGEIGTIVSAGIAGMMAGGFIFSWIADRIGRRPTIVAAAFAFGILTAATALAQNVPQLIMLRFLDGLAIGGMLPLAWALNIEYVPRRMRATVVTIIMMGYSLGSAIAGPLTNMLAPEHGWRAVYLAGGTGTIICAAALLFGLPESVRFLVSRQMRLGEAKATLRRLIPGVDVTASDRLYLGDEPPAHGTFRVSELFAGDLRLLTPLLWIAYFASSLAIYFSSSWGPIILEDLDYPRSVAANISSFNGVLGALAGLSLMRFTDRHGAIAVAMFPALAVPALLVLGMGMLSHDLFIIGVTIGAVCVSGAHFGILSILGIYYPSSIRASGSGWATSVGKLGGVLGPLVGAVVLSSGLPIIRSYAILAICPAVLVVAALLIAAVNRRRAARPGLVTEPLLTS